MTLANTWMPLHKWSVVFKRKSAVVYFCTTLGTMIWITEMFYQLKRIARMSREMQQNINKYCTIIVNHHSNFYHCNQKEGEVLIYVNIGVYIYSIHITVHKNDNLSKYSYIISNFK